MKIPKSIGLCAPLCSMDFHGEQTNSDWKVEWGLSRNSTAGLITPTNAYSPLSFTYVCASDCCADSRIPAAASSIHFKPYFIISSNVTPVRTAEAFPVVLVLGQRRAG